MSFRLGLVLLSLIWGSQFVVIKVGQESLPPLLTVGARYMIVLLFAQAFLVLRPAPLARRTGLGRLIYASAQALSMALMYWGTGQLPSSVAALILGVTPFAVHLAAHYVVPGERLGRHAVLATCSGFAGLVVLLAFGSRPADAVALSAAGALAMVGVVVADTVTKVSAKRLVTELPTPVLLRDMSFASAAFGVVGHWLFEADSPVLFTLSGVAAFVYLGVVASAFASALYLELLKKHAVGSLAYLQFLTTLIAILCGTWIAGERLPTALWFGAGLVLLGLLVRSKAASQPSRTA